MKQTQLPLHGVDESLRLFTSNPIKKSLLEFLSSYPRRLLMSGPEESPNLCLALGKCLLWIASEVDDNRGPNFYADVELGETATNVKALGEQFCRVGGKLLCGSPARLEARVLFLQSRVEELRQEIHRSLTQPQPGPLVQVIDTPSFMRLKADPKRHAAQLAGYREGRR